MEINRLVRKNNMILKDTYNKSPEMNCVEIKNNDFLKKNAFNT